MNKRLWITIVMVIAIALAGCTSTPTATTAPEQPKATEAPKGPPAACASDPFGCAKIEPGQTIKIGMGAPMTGGDASFGIDISQGAKLAVSDAGDFQGWKFELIAEDDQGSAEGGAAVANKLVADQTVVAIAGHIYSGATAAAIPIYEKVGLPMLSPSATNPALTTKGSTVFNRIAFTDSIQSAFAAEYIFKTLGAKKIAVMHDGSDYGKGLAELVAAKFTELGGEVTASQAITPKETDYSAPLAAVAATKPEVVYFGGYTQEGAIIANQMKQTGLEKAVFFGCDGTYGKDFLDRTAANGEGSYAVSLTPPDTETKVKFDAAYLAAYGSAPGTLSPFSWNGYDVTAALISVVKAVGVKGDDGNLYIPRSAMVKGVRGLTNYQGISGTFTCNEVGECNASGPFFVVVKDGKWAGAVK